MTKNYYKTENHNTFGGLIFASDFNTDYRGKDSQNGSSITSRILSDWKFDEDCRKNIENRDKNKNYKKGVK